MSCSPSRGIGTGDEIGSRDWCNRGSCMQHGIVIVLLLLPARGSVMVRTRSRQPTSVTDGGLHVKTERGCVEFFLCWASHWATPCASRCIFICDPGQHRRQPLFTPAPTSLSLPLHSVAEHYAERARRHDLHVLLLARACRCRPPGRAPLAAVAAESPWGARLPPEHDCIGAYARAWPRLRLAP